MRRSRTSGIREDGGGRCGHMEHDDRRLRGARTGGAGAAARAPDGEARDETRRCHTHEHTGGVCSLRPGRRGARVFGDGGARSRARAEQGAVCLRRGFARAGREVRGSCRIGGKDAGEGGGGSVGGAAVGVPDASECGGRPAGLRTAASVGAWECGKLRDDVQHICESSKVGRCQEGEVDDAEERVVEAIWA